MRSIQQGVGLSSAQDDEIIDLSALFSSIWRGKTVIMFAVVAALLIGGFYAYLIATPMYQSTAVVMLNNRTETVVERGSVIGALESSNTVVTTEVQILRGRVLLGKVVDQLNLMQDPEFNASLRPLSAIRKVKNEARDLVGSAFNENASVASAEVTSERTTRQREATISRLLSALTVVNVPSSLVFQVTVETTSPEKSATIADTLVELYILNQLEVKFEATEQATAWLTDRVTDLQISLEEAESRVKNFSANTTLVSPEALQGLEVQIKEMRDRIESTRSGQQTARSRLAAINAVETPEEQAAASGDLQLQRLLPRIEESGVAEAFNTRLEQLKSRFEADILRSESQLVALQDSLATLEAQSEQQSADLITLQQLTREAEASRLLYEYFLGRLKETSAQQGIQQTDSRVLSPAVVSTRATSPRKPIILALSMVLGALIGTAFVLLREARNRAFRNADQLESLTGYATIGQIPLIQTSRRKDAITYLKEKPSSAASEAIRNLRTSVMLSNVDTPPQVIMVSSALSGEGKTTLALSLALNFATMGKKVLLLEGDIRRRVFSQYLDTKEEDGIVSVLSGTRNFEDVVVHDTLLEADVLLGDEGQANAADIFSSERFSNLVRDLRRRYDIVIIDTPPVLIVPDARVIAQYVDATIFVVKWDRTQKEQVINALREFESVGKPVSGLVLNQISPRGMKRYGYGNAYGPYSTYGAKYYVN